MSACDARANCLTSACEALYVEAGGRAAGPTPRSTEGGDHARSLRPSPPRSAPHRAAPDSQRLRCCCGSSEPGWLSPPSPHRDHSCVLSCPFQEEIFCILVGVKLFPTHLSLPRGFVRVFVVQQSAWSECRRASSDGRPQARPPARLRPCVSGCLRPSEAPPAAAAERRGEAAAAAAPWRSSEQQQEEEQQERQEEEEEQEDFSPDRSASCPVEVPPPRPVLLHRGGQKAGGSKSSSERAVSCACLLGHLHRNTGELSSERACCIG